MSDHEHFDEVIREFSPKNEREELIDELCGGLNTPDEIRQRALLDQRPSTWSLITRRFSFGQLLFFGIFSGLALVYLYLASKTGKG